MVWADVSLALCVLIMLAFGAWSAITWWKKAGEDD